MGGTLRVFNTNNRIIDYPFTVSGWGYFDATDTTSRSTSLYFANKTSDFFNDYMYVAFGVNTGGSGPIFVTVACAQTSSSFASSSISQARPSSSGWHHVVGVLSANNSRRAWLNGNAATLNTATINVDLPSGDVSQGFGGQTAIAAAECGIWDVALTDAEIASLAAGISCKSVRPASLVHYAPLVRDAKDIMRSCPCLTASRREYAGSNRCARTPDPARPDAAPPDAARPDPCTSASCEGGATAVGPHVRSLFAQVPRG